MWCISKIDDEFRKRMYDILDLYNEPYNPKEPVIGLDEKTKQIIADKRSRVPMKPGSPERYDYEYVRKGTANIFVAVDFKGGKRATVVTNKRTKQDFALVVKQLVDVDFKKADKLLLTIDNLNTHFESSFYETFSKKEARRILNKVEFHYTPKHGSWLNVAEIEINVMEVECTGRRFRDTETLRSEVETWTKRRNQLKEKIDWKFTKKDADRRMSKHYV